MVLKRQASSGPRPLCVRASSWHRGLLGPAPKHMFPAGLGKDHGA